MFERFDLRSVFTAHFRAISYTDAGTGKVRKHWSTIIILVAVTAAATIATALLGATLKNGSAFLSASALFSAILLAVFAQLATLRGRTTDDSQDLAEAIDEGVAHVMAAEILTLLATLVLAIGLGTSCDSAVHGPFAVAAVGLMTYTVLVLIMLVPNLLWAYTQVNDVRDELNGFHRKR